MYEEMRTKNTNIREKHDSCNKCPMIYPFTSANPLI